jgi:hypothetical protein
MSSITYRYRNDGFRSSNNNQGMETDFVKQETNPSMYEEETSMEASSSSMSTSIGSSGSENIAEDNNNAKRHKVTLSNIDAISTKAYKIIEEIHRMALEDNSTRKGLYSRDDLYKIFYEKKTREVGLFKADINKSLEGTPTDSKLQDFLKANEIFFDDAKQKFFSENNSKGTRIPGNEIHIDAIRKKCCVDIPPEQNFSVVVDKIEAAYKSREEILNFVPFSEQLLEVMENASTYNIRYREVRFERGINDIPVPQTFIDEVEKNVAEVEKNIKNKPGASPKKMEEVWERKMEAWEKYINEKQLINILNDDEKAVLNRTLIEQYYPTGSESLYKKIIGKSYTEAFEILFEQVIKTAKQEIEPRIKEINRQNQGPVLDPDIFSARSSYTLKLNFELPHQPTLAEYYFRLTAIYMYVLKKRKKNKDTEIVGVTIDLENNSVQHNDYQIAYLKYLRMKYTKEKSNLQENDVFVPVSIQALELPDSQMNNINDRKDRLSKVIRLSERVSPIINNLNCDVTSLQSVGVEICLTTISLTEITEKPNPFLWMDKGVPIFTNTNHSGVVLVKNGFKETSKAFIDVIHSYKLNFRRHIEDMERNALETSFLQGKSIYDIELVRESDKKTVRKYSIKSFYQPIVTMSDAEFINFIGNLTPKEQKQCQLERDLYSFKKYIVDNELIFLRLGHLTPEFFYK